MKKFQVTHCNIFKNWKNELIHIKDVYIAQWLPLDTEKKFEPKLHIYSDNFKSTYGAVAYIKTKGNNKSLVYLLSKST